MMALSLVGIPNPFIHRMTHQLLLLFSLIYGNLGITGPKADVMGLKVGNGDLSGNVILTFYVYFQFLLYVLLCVDG